MMEVHFTREVQSNLDEMAQESGCAPSELAHSRETIDRHRDDLESGRVKPNRRRGFL
jgi:hypothetical protein